MTVLDTFYLLFKTDIPTSTQKEVAALDKQLDEMGKKGKKRTEDENKQYEQLKKQRKELLDDTKQQQREVDKLGESFNNIATNILGAVTAFATFSGLKTGILDTAKFNADIATQGKVLHQNTDELRAYGAAAAHFGGDAADFISRQTAIAQNAAKVGISYKNVAAFYDSLHNLVKGQDVQDQQRIFSLYGITDIHDQLMLISDDYEEQIQLQNRLAVATHTDYEESLRFREATQDLDTEFKTAFTKLGTDVLPAASYAFRYLTGTLKELEKEGGGIEAFFAKVATAALLAATPLRAYGAALLVAGEVGQAVTDVATGSRKSFLARKINGLILGGTDEYSSPSTSGSGGTGNAAVDFWLSQGKPLYQAIALAANEQRESGGNPDARNYDKGIHYGLYQFDENRRRDIFSALGIDVAHADANQQRLAAAWDLHRRGNDAGLDKTNNYADATDYINRAFEVSGENSGVRIGIANQIASQIPSIPPSVGAGNKALNVKIDNVTISTQATDATGISKAFAQQLQNDLGGLYYDWNDGVEY